MPDLVLRLAWLNAAWGLQARSDREQFLRAEFLDEAGNPDLRLSVFVVNERNDVVRVCAECRASSNLGKRGEYFVFNVVGLFEPTMLHKMPGDTRFTFTREAHREIHFENAARLRHFIDDLILSADERKIIVSRVAVKEYFQKQLESNDGEWAALRAVFPNWKP